MLRFELHLRWVLVASVKRALLLTYQDVIKNSTFEAAAALSYYSLFGVFPGLILLSEILGHIPAQNFFADVLIALGRVAPPGTMPMVESVLNDILGRNSGAWLSLGTLGTLWVVSSAFDELIEALDAACDVQDSRPFWKTRLLALALAAVTGFFILCGIATMIVGPRAGQWIAARLSLSHAFELAWPILHWTLAIVFAMLAVEAIYFLAPQIKQTFLATLPGAVLTVTCWIALSHLLGIYFHYFANYNRTYGTLGGVMGLMTWLYWSFFILLAGCELNAELAKQGIADKLEHGGSITKRRRSTDRAA
jgi:membrane protein